MAKSPTSRSTGRLQRPLPLTLAAIYIAMIPTTARAREAKAIRDANKASAMGRLLLGQIHEWGEFLEPDTKDYESLPRQQLKSGKKSVQKDCRKEIERFCRNNFTAMNHSKLVRLYEMVKSKRHLEIPYLEFQEKFGDIKSFVKSGHPRHATVCISLWGLQYRFPEKDFSDDLSLAVEEALSLGKKLAARHSENRSHSNNVSDKEMIAKWIKGFESAKRRIIQGTYSLVECFLNGLAWDYIRSVGESSAISANARKRLQDTTSVSIRDKMIKYPRDIFGKAPTVGHYLMDTAKPFRDSLMHPSPFSAPEKFGGYDKLEKIYGIKWDVVSKTLDDLIKYIESLVSIGSGAMVEPVWLPDLRAAANKAIQADAFGAADL